MATPQRNLPDEPRREAVDRDNRTVETRRVLAVPARRSGSFFWVWIVLFIAAIIWFCGWGWGGAGGWWWGRTAAVHTAQPANGAAGVGTTGNVTGTSGSGTNASGTAGSGYANGGVVTSNGGQSSAPMNNGTASATGNGQGRSTTGNVGHTSGGGTAGTTTGGSGNSGGSPR